jgi:Icc-related predicted phosphoesterase
MSKKSEKGRYASLFQKASEEADVLLICGDLTDTGSEEEAQNLADDAKSSTIPILATLGNHDYEADQQESIRTALLQSNIILLEGESKKIKDTEFFGLKGFSGGFDNFMLASWGEKATKEFVKIAVEDALHLDSILSHSDAAKKVLFMHYSPIRATVVGEPEEVFPFLGSSHYEEVINRRAVQVVFHGHAHRGTHQGKTKTEIPVFNVSQSLITTTYPDKPYLLYEI